MLTLPPSTKVFVATTPVDLRRGFDGLARATRQIILKDPTSGHLFVFINRRANLVKILMWDRTGYLLLHKRLSRGSFFLPKRPEPGKEHIQLDGPQLMLMLEGLELRGAKQRRRLRR